MLTPISHLFRCFGSDVGANHSASASNMPPPPPPPPPPPLPSGQPAAISPALPLPAATTSASDATAPPWQGMTRKSLKAWAYEPGVSKRERQDRLKLRRTLLESSKRRDGWLYVRSWLFFNRWVENGEFNSESIDEFSTLPNGLWVELIDGNMFHLQKTPIGLRVESLGLNFCNALTEISPGCSVGVNLTLSRCPLLRALPTDLRVGGNIELTDIPLLTDIPVEILSWPPKADGNPHQIHLHNTGITPDTRLRLASLIPNPPGVQLHFSEEYVHRMFFFSIQEAWDFWQTAFLSQEEQSMTRSFHPFAHLSTIQIDKLENFLGQLVDTAEYRHPQARLLLKKRVMAMATPLQNPEFIEVGLEILAIAGESCSDRLIRGLDEFELAWLVHNTPASGLRSLGERVFKLERVREYARLKVASLSVVDEVEIYLFFETELAEALDLPIQTRHRMYGAPVEPDELEAVKFLVHRDLSDHDLVEDFFNTWRPWQVVRQNIAQACLWENLPIYQKQDIAADATCVFTLEPLPLLHKPVALGAMAAYPTPMVAEFEPMLQWWAMYGTHPVAPGQAVGLQSLSRLQR